jgi:hypothetical protein
MVLPHVTPRMLRRAGTVIALSAGTPACSRASEHFREAAQDPAKLADSMHFSFLGVVGFGA